MTIANMPSWATARVDGIPAEQIFDNIDERIKIAKQTEKMFLAVHEMTGVNAFLLSAEKQAIQVDIMEYLISKNRNLYCIVTKGYGLN